MEILLNVWLAFNVVFGLWSSRNWVLWCVAKFNGGVYRQGDVGRVLDLLILVSILAYSLSV